MSEKVEVIIKIPKKDYNKMCRGELVDTILVAIKEGTPLPKNHGRLKDIDKIENLLDLDKPNNVVAENIKKIIDTVPTLIEADKE